MRQSNAMVSSGEVKQKEYHNLYHNSLFKDLKMELLPIFHIAYFWSEQHPFTLSSLRYLPTYQLRKFI
ncbi:hypothetical protein HZS_5555 [Henneguya salminicola]|nr:hypothetical protein HZS_5555 [Henneguya salminicola]